jgi:regulator of protease activity HflC (stomatin/prohibitin superfamily)
VNPLDLIGQLFNTALSLCPRLTFVRKTHGAVVFRPGGKIRQLTPGLHWYWPLTSEVEEIITARQTHSLCHQTITTKDGTVLAVSAVLVYRVENVTAALVECYDVAEAIEDVVLSAVAEVLSRAKVTPNLLARTELPLTRLSRSRLRPFGVSVLRCCLVDFAPCRVLRCITDGGAVLGAEGE